MWRRLVTLEDDYLVISIILLIFSVKTIMYSLEFFYHLNAKFILTSFDNVSLYALLPAIIYIYIYTCVCVCVCVCSISCTVTMSQETTVESKDKTSSKHMW
jgi:hypothetical protein